jgi:hypothetical protein
MWISQRAHGQRAAGRQGTLSVTFTDAELNQAIRLAQQMAAQTGQPILIHDAQTRFSQRPDYH